MFEFIAVFSLYIPGISSNGELQAWSTVSGTGVSGTGTGTANLLNITWEVGFFGPRGS